MSKNCARYSGFTLIEAMVAALILAISAVAIGGSVNQSLHALRRARDYQRSAELLDGVMTRIDLLGPDRVAREGPLEGTFEPPDDRFSWDAQVDSLIDGFLFEITVNVRWDDGYGAHTASLSTRINDPPKSRNERLRWEDLQ